MQPVIVTAEEVSKRFEVNALASDTPVDVEVSMIGIPGPVGPVGPQGPPGQDGNAGNETDPVFLASAAHGISSGDIANWNSKEVGGAAAAALSVAESYTDTHVAAGIVTAEGYTDSAISGLSAVYVPLTRTVNGQALSGNVTVTASDVGLGNVDNTSDANKPVSTAQAAAIALKVTANVAITGATKTKITYDAKGLVTAGADATTADIADSSNKRYVTDAQLVVIGNTSGVNTGDQSLSGYMLASGATVGATSQQQVFTNGIGTVAQDAVQINPYGASAGNTGEIRFYELAANGTHYTGFKAPDSFGGVGVSNIIYILPVTPPNSNQILKSTALVGSVATLSWGDLPNVVVPAGSNADIQYNQAGGFGANGDGHFQWDNNNEQVLLKNATGIANPSYSFTDAPLAGTYWDGALGLTANGTDGWKVNTDGVLFPVTDGEDIGIAGTNRIANIYMSSNIDYVTDLNFTVGGVPKFTLDNTGKVTLGEWNGTAIADGFIASAATWNAKQDALGFTAVPDTRTVNGHALSGNISVTASDVGLGSVDNTSDASKPVSTAQATAIGLKVTANGAITGATKTKITYDTKGLITSGADATTADIADSTNKRYVTDAHLTILGNTSGTNTGDNATNSQYSGLVSNATHTGDVTGATALTIAAAAVTLAKMANLAANSIIGNNTASPATPLALTAAQTKTLLALTSADVGLGSVENTALSTWAGSANITTLGTITTGIWNGTNIPNNKIVTNLSSHTMVWSAGSTTVTPQQFTSGALTTGANILAGAMGYEGTIIAGVIDTTSGWGQIPVEQYFHLTADGTNVTTTIGNFFGATSNISLVASAYYEIEILMVFLKTTTEILTITLTNSAAPTSQNIRWEQSPITGMVAPPGTATALVGFLMKDATAAKAIAAGSLTTAVNHYIKINIQLQNGTGTSLKIQATNPAGSITPRLGSYWKCRRVSPNNIGTFAA